LLFHLCLTKQNGKCGTIQVDQGQPKKQTQLIDATIKGSTTQTRFSDKDNGSRDVGLLCTSRQSVSMINAWRGRGNESVMLRLTSCKHQQRQIDLP